MPDEVADTPETPATPQNVRVPQRFGPYRVERRLGIGGMGEVYSAWDERLERRVAVKLIRPESAESPAARERFRREARAAAALNHPAIVQIYDVLDTEQGDAIVMEHVEGHTLAQLLATAAPAAAVALALAAQVAEGLAAAHARGIVHRDLKAENVMVTPAGQAKIVDFGLARHEHGGNTSESSASGMAGTYKAMSPEQARALPVDRLSDLFSFGSLLHELFTGRSPFASSSPLETLTNVCTRIPPPLREMNPEVPEALSVLVERLLQKEPGRRPQDTAAVADDLREMLASTSGENDAARRLSAWSRTAAQASVGVDQGPLGDRHGATARSSAPASSARGRRRRWRFAVAIVLVAGAAGAAWLATRTRAVPPLSVAVPRVVFEGPSSEAAETMQAGARAALLHGLLSLAGVAPVAPDLIDPVPGSALDVARAVAADELLTAHLACQSETCRATLARLDGQNGRLLWTVDFETPPLEPAVLPALVLGHLRHAYPGRGLRKGMRPLEVGPADFAEYLALQRGFDSQGQQGASLATLDARLAALRQRAPSFVEAGLFEAEVLRRRFLDSRDRAQLERAAAVLQSLRDAAPGDPRPLAVLFEVALSRADLDGAETTLDELERLQPADPGVWMLRARLLSRRQADPARVLELSRAAVRRQPSYLNLLRAAQIENLAGGSAGTQVARTYLEELLRRYPTYAVGRSNLAQIELLKGSPERAARLYGELARGSPTLAVLANLGIANLLLARYAEAEQALRQAAGIAPANPQVALNLADVVLLQKRDDEARVLYRRVLSLADADPAGSQWEIRSVTAQAHAHLGERREAAEALQRMLAVAGDDPQAAAEAAVTYAVLGEQASTLASAARALRGGVDARWLRLPWFSGPGDSPELRALLADTGAAETTHPAANPGGR